MVCGNKLYVANVGDSRAVVVCQTPNGTLETLQLSTDHDVKNEDELKRLEQLGLDQDELDALVHRRTPDPLETTT